MYYVISIIVVAVAVAIATIALRIIRSRVSAGHPVLAPAIAIVVLFGLIYVVSLQVYLDIRGLFPVAGFAVGIGYLAVQQEPFTTRALLRCIALLLALIGLVSISGLNLLVASISIASAGVMLYLESLLAVTENSSQGNA